MARTVFVAMPFRSEYNPILETIKEAAALLGLRVVQIGEEPFVGSIISQIRSSIEGADLMVAVVTEENGNVYYEIGLAHCQRKPVVLLTDDPKSLKFDLRDHRAIVYDRANPSVIRDELARTFSAALDPPEDPERYLASTSRHNGGSTSKLQQAIREVSRQAELQEPVSLKSAQVLKQSSELALEVEDFLGTSVRAVVDINGIVRVLKRL